MTAGENDVHAPDHYVALCAPHDDNGGWKLCAPHDGLNAVESVLERLGITHGLIVVLLLNH